MGSKNVGKPVKDPYTGEIKNHHLGNSDVTLQVSVGKNGSGIAPFQSHAEHD